MYISSGMLACDGTLLNKWGWLNNWLIKDVKKSNQCSIVLKSDTFLNLLFQVHKFDMFRAIVRSLAVCCLGIDIKAKTIQSLNSDFGVKIQHCCQKYITGVSYFPIRSAKNDNSVVFSRRSHYLNFDLLQPSVLFRFAINNYGRINSVAPLNESFNWTTS